MFSPRRELPSSCFLPSMKPVDVRGFNNSAGALDTEMCDCKMNVQGNCNGNAEGSKQ
jgi:hypothetical protein